MSFTLKIKFIAIISSSATKDLELANIKKKEQNKMKKLKRKKYINIKFVIIAYRFALFELLKQIISNYILRKNIKLKKTMIIFLFLKYMNHLRLSRN
jgi:hypothetical protein